MRNTMTKLSSLLVVPFGALFMMTTIMLAAAQNLPAASDFYLIDTFSISRSPSGLFFDDTSGILYALAGTSTNGDHALYAVDLQDGSTLCSITIPQAVGMSRVDGFYITQDMAYIVDSQGPIYADTEGRLGGSVYQVSWTDPCACSDGACSSSQVTWSPTVLQQWSLSALDVSAQEGGTNDEYFRNSGIVVVGSSWYGVNGVHPISGSLSVSYPKSLVKFDMDLNEIVQSWAFDGTTVGRDVDMEGLTCGPDHCLTSLYIGDEYNMIYELDLASGTVTREWDISSIVTRDVEDKGIEALSYSSVTGYFYAGIQETANIHVLNLLSSTTTDDDDEEDTTEEEESTTPTTLSACEESQDYPVCEAPTISLEDKRIRREIRSLSSKDWEAVVNAMWIMKTTSLTEGQNLYGPSFKPYDHFVVKHAVATTDARGDQAHFGAHFMTWHLAFVLEFEMALLAIDPSIGAMPYWDETLAEPSVFTDDYFGSDTTAENNFVITDRAFANWPVSTFSWADYESFLTGDASALGFGMDDTNGTSTFLRGDGNLASEAFVVQYGSGTNWEQTTITATLENDWWACTVQDLVDWNSWYACIESGSPSFHSGPHASIGGIMQAQRKLQQGGGPPNGGGGGPPGGGGGTAEMLRGDFEDTVTSPNGPIFMFHHANLDRNRLWWMRRHNQEGLVCSYYDFPLENALVSTWEAQMKEGTIL